MMTHPDIEKKIEDFISRADESPFDGYKDWLRTALQAMYERGVADVSDTCVAHERDFRKSGAAEMKRRILNALPGNILRMWMPQEFLTERKQTIKMLIESLENMRKIKEISAWAVLRTYPRRVKYPVEPEIAKADIETDCGCGSPSTSAIGIYLTEQSANFARQTNTWYGEEQIVVPCTITYHLPTPSSKE